jgi:arabinose-5-phosphate isomerase
MEAALRKPTSQLDAAAQLAAGREVLRLEAVALWKLSHRLDESFQRVLRLLLLTKGNVIVTGMGKAGHVGQKISATLASTGTRSYFLHPGEAFHGDLGRVGPNDTVVILSQSGETGEILQLLDALATMQVPLIAITARSESTLGRAATEVIELGMLEEACSLGLAPSTSTTAMLAVGDALALVVSKLRGFRAEDFARFHPGGSLGRKLRLVEDQMRPLSQCRVASENLSVRQVIVACSKPGRRTGAVMLIDDTGALTGLFTDSDLARMLESHRDADLEQPVSQFMTRKPLVVEVGSRTQQAIELMASRKLSELPVVDGDGKPVGLIDVTDVVGLVPGDEEMPPTLAKPTVRLFPSEDVFGGGH